MSGAEHRLIAALASRLPAASRPLLGDDAAVVDGTVVCTDVLVEDVDFRASWGEPASIGWRALAANVSDVYAMGATPTAAVVAVVLGRHSEDWWVEVYDGLGRAADRFAVTVAGGDISAGPAAVVSVALLGRPGRRVTWRHGAQPGDLLVVSAPIGGAAAGLACLEGRRPRDLAAVEAFRWPAPAPAFPDATAMIDISDGLGADALRLAAASGVDVVIEADRIPRGPGATLEDALGGGEDFVLPASVPPTSHGVGHVIGRVEAVGSGSRLVHADGSVHPLEATGWDHLEP